MTIEEKIEEIKAPAKRLVGLLENPHPGLFTWVDAVGDVLAEIASHAPADSAERMARKK